MANNFYKPIKRRYYETYSIYEKHKIGTFIARGQWADGHLAYTLLDENGDSIDECSYVQMRGNINGKHCLYMQRV